MTVLQFPRYPDPEPPTEPVAEAECPHCDGTAVVEGEWYVDGHGETAAEFPCTYCDREGVAPVDADGVCACEECLHYPRAQRAGSAYPDEHPEETR